jgi:hypothetical protein
MVSHLQIHRDAGAGAQPPDVLLLNMPPVFPQMNGDAFRAASHAEFRRFCRVRVRRSPGLPQGGDVIDIHTESQQ